MHIEKYDCRTGKMRVIEVCTGAVEFVAQRDYGEPQDPRYTFTWDQEYDEGEGGLE